MTGDIKLDPGGGWQEAVVSVKNLDVWREIADAACGWRQIGGGAVAPAQLHAWGLKGEIAADEALFQCGDEPQGLVRFVSFKGAQQIRVRARGIENVAEGFLDRGFTMVADPVTFDYNGQILTNVILRGPDGISFGVYERVEPPLAGWPHVTRLSQPFNAMQIVRSRNATRDFHRDVLGFGAFVDNDARNPEPKPSNFGFPINLTTAYVTKAAIMHPRGRLNAKERDNGRVELIEWDGFDGRDLSARAVPPNLGVLMLRWPVKDAAADAARIGALGHALFRPPAQIDVAPYGRITAFALRTPDGVIYELFSKA